MATIIANIIFGEQIRENKSLATFISALVGGAVIALILALLAYYAGWHFLNWPKNWSRYWGGGILQIRPWELKRLTDNKPRFKTIFQNMYAIMFLILLPVTYIALTIQYG